MSRIVRISYISPEEKERRRVGVPSGEGAFCVAWGPTWQDRWYGLSLSHCIEMCDSNGWDYTIAPGTPDVCPVRAENYPV